MALPSNDIRQTHKRIQAGLLIISLLFTLSACASVRLSPERTVIWGMEIYNGEYERYKRQAAREDLSEEEKEILRDKKDILTDLHPIITLMDTALAEGKLPDEEVQEDMVYLINRLIGD